MLREVGDRDKGDGDGEDDGGGGGNAENALAPRSQASMHSRCLRRTRLGGGVTFDQKRDTAEGLESES